MFQKLVSLVHMVTFNLIQKIKRYLSLNGTIYHISTNSTYFLKLKRLNVFVKTNGRRF